MKVLLIFFVVICSSWRSCSSKPIPYPVQTREGGTDTDRTRKLLLVRSDDTFLNDRLLSDRRRVHRVTRDDEGDEEVVEADAEEKVEESKIVDSKADSDEEEKYRKKMHGWLKLGTGIYVFFCVILWVITLVRYNMDGCPCLQGDSF